MTQGDDSPLARFHLVGHFVGPLCLIPPIFAPISQPLSKSDSLFRVRQGGNHAARDQIQPCLAVKLPHPAVEYALCLLKRRLEVGEQIAPVLNSH